MNSDVFTKDKSLALKGIAIIMMLFHHNFRSIEVFQSYSISFYPFSEESVVLICNSFKICVSLFAFISGYGLTLSYKNNSDCNGNKWVLNKLFKILSGFWFIYIISSVICELINRRTSEIFFSNGEIFGTFQVVIDFLGLSNLFHTKTLNGTWWYMSAAIIFICLIPILNKSIDKFGAILVLLLCVIIPRATNIGYFGANSAFSFLFMLLLGIIFSRNNLFYKLDNILLCKNIFTSKIIKFMIETFLVIIMFYSYSAIPDNILWEYKWGIFPLFLICYLHEFVVSIKYIKSVLIFLGKHSMNIFMIHTFIRAVYLNEFIYSFNNFIIITSVLLLISLGISIIVEYLKKIFKYNDIVNSIIRNYLI